MKPLAPVPQFDPLVVGGRPVSIGWFNWFNGLRDRVLGVPIANASTFAALPAVPELGMLVTVTDSSTAVRGAVVAGGGALIVLAHYDGTDWRVV